MLTVRISNADVDIRTVLTPENSVRLRWGVGRNEGGGAIDRNWQAVSANLIGGSEVAGCNDSRHWSATQDGDT